MPSILQSPAGQLATWRYHFTDMRSGRYITALPLVGASFSDVAGGVGQGEGSVPIASAEVRKRDPWAATVPRRTVCWAERLVTDPNTGRASDARIMWAGPILSSKRSRSGRSIALGMVSWAGWFARRLVGTDRTFTNTDDFTIMRWLFQQALDRPYGGAAGLFFDSTNLAGTLSTRTYLASDLKNVLSAATQLATAQPGFDWRFAYSRQADPNVPFRADLLMGYPRLGRGAGSPAGPIAPDLVWSSKRNTTRAGYLLDYDDVIEGSATNNHLVGMGSGTGPTQVRGEVYADDLGRNELASGYPLWEDSLPSATTDLTTQAAIDAHVRGAMAAGLASEHLVGNVQVRGDLAPYVTAYDLCDDVTLRIADSYSPGSTEVVAKLVGRKMVPPEKGRTEKVAMVLQPSVPGLVA